MKNTHDDKKIVSCFLVSNNSDSIVFGVLKDVEKMYENAEDHRLKIQLDSLAKSLNASLNKMIALRNRYSL